MNNLARKLAQDASRKVDLIYPGDAYPATLIKLITQDLTDEFKKVKWMGDDESWEKAVKAVIKEVETRYTK